MKTNPCLYLLASLVLACIALPLHADGFIVINPPVPLPPVHFAVSPLEVKYHHVDVKINGQICTTTVDEDFFNPNPQQLEGTYLFPIPKNAQIDKFTMQIAGKELSAELLDASKARALYEDIVRQRLDPALMEYADRGLFKVRIFPIEGMGHKQVKITYSEILKSDAGLISYTYPLNTEKFSSSLIRDVSIKVDLSSDQPLHSIYSPTHTVEIKHTSPTHAVVGYEIKESRPDTDFKLFFSPEETTVSMKMLSYQTGDNDGYFLLLASPSLNLDTKPVPKDVTFVLDTSGSMSGNKIKQAKKALEFCLSNLNSEDRFEVIRFSTESEPLFDHLTPADGKAVEKAESFVEKLKPGGGTAIYDALGKALALRPSGSDRPYVIIFLTDGEPTVGETSDDAIVSETDKAHDTNTRIFCFGLGNDVNAHLLDRIADHTHAASDYVLPNEDIEVTVSNFFSKISEPVLSNVKLSFPEQIHISKMYPQTVPDLFKGDQLIVTGRYSGSGAGTCALEGDANGSHQKFNASLHFVKEDTEQSFVPRLWASRRVAYLLDEIRMHGENLELKSEITDIAREFGLVTPYTAYLIMEDEETRKVSSSNQVLRNFSRDKEARDSAHATYFSLQLNKSGDAAVATARGQNEMKYARVADEAIKKSNEEYFRSMNVPASAATSPTSNVTTQPAPSADASTRVAQYTQTSRYLLGRTFYLNKNQWIDSRLSKQNGGKEVRLKFGSPEYFAFSAEHPEARLYLSLGKNVRLLLADTVYDIFDDSDGPASSSHPI